MNKVGWHCGAVAILNRNVVSRCGAVRILCTKWAGVVARWPFWIVTWSPAVVRCEFCEQSGLRSLQRDLHVAGVIWKGRRWRFEGGRRACRVAGGVYLTHRGGGTP